MKKNMLVGIVAILAAAGAASARVHSEIGDAGNLAGGQLTGNGALSAIEGALAANDVDMYSIRIDDWATFSANTTNITGLVSTESDTQLFLFDTLGIAIAMNDDTSGSVFRSTLEAGSAIYSGRTAGEVVWIAVSGYNTDPSSAAGLIFNNVPFASLARPATGPGAAGAVESWAGPNATGGSYRISLAGASAVPAPGALAILGLTGVVAGRRRRVK